jgi:hypothetical protein
MEKDSPRRYLFVEDVGIVGVCIVRIFGGVFEICMCLNLERRG